MYKMKFIKIRHDITKQCHGNYKEMNRFNYKLEVEVICQFLLCFCFVTKHQIVPRPGIMK